MGLAFKRDQRQGWFKLKRPDLGVALILLLPLLFTQNCSEDGLQFDSAGPNTKARYNYDIKTGTVTENFGVNVVDTRKLDIVWVIDNSGSMGQEVAHVRNNYETFVRSVQGYADIKTALISDSVGGGHSHPLSLPTGLDPDKHMQIDFFVSSWNPMCLTQNAFMAQGPYLNCASHHYDHELAEQKLHGQLAPFFRQESQKIFVFVTDDNEDTTNKTTFLNSFQTTYGQSPIVYSFVALGASQSPCQADEGTRYQGLSQETEGAVFNICTADWTNHFEQMTDHISTVTDSTFSLRHADVLEILKVTVDGAELSRLHYSLQNGLLTIDEAFLFKDSEIHIQYKVNE